MSDSEFLPVWKKYPGVAETMIKAILSMMLVIVRTLIRMIKGFA